MRKRIASTALALIMALSLVAFSAPVTLAASSEGYEYTVSGGNAIITGYSGGGVDITIPSKLVFYTVTAISDFAFSNNTSLTSVTIPDSITSIGVSAFQGCISLKSISISNNVTYIGERAFYSCSSLVSISIPDGVKTISESMFSNCKSLTSVILPNSITSIGKEAFSYCWSMVDFTIPNGVTFIGEYAFSNCWALTNVTVPRSVASIGTDAFRWNDNLTLSCYTNSAAHTYAQKNNIPFSLLDAGVLYTISFSKGNGSGSWDSLSKKVGETVTITNAITKAFTRKGYLFSHFSGSDGKQHKAGAVIPITGDLTLIAQYSKVSVNKGTTPKLTKESGKIRVRYDKVSNAAGYQFVVSTSKTFAAGKGGSKTYVGYQKNYIPSCAGKKLKSGTTYYVKIRAYRLDSQQNRVWGTYSAVTSIKF